MCASVLIQKNEQGVGTITLNKPKVMNPMNTEVFSALGGAVAQMGTDVSVRVVVIEGAGGNFSSGGDLKILEGIESSPAFLDIMALGNAVIRGLREIPQPIVSKVSGIAYGYGANLALASDFVIASETAKFRQAFINAGLAPDGGGQFYLSRLVGLAKARELTMLGKEINGKQAEKIGLIYKAVREEDLDRETEVLANELAGRPPRALAVIKNGLDKSFNMSLKDSLEWEAGMQSVLSMTAEHKEALNRFLNR